MSDGEQIVGDYRLLNLIASGNASNIWEVVEQGGTQAYAMKLLLPEKLADRDQKETLKREMKVGKLFAHPNFVSFHKLSITKKHAYLIMDYFRAPNLKSQLNLRPTEVHARLVKLVESVCLSLGHMHDHGWLHRDIKPENILFNKSSELRLIDFSLATRASSGLGKLVGGKAKVIQGTRTYIAPETLLKKKPTEQTDMYSLGITLYECLTGQPPFRGSSPSDLLKRHLADVPLEPSELNENVTPEMDAFVLRMLSKKPKDRHESMNEVAAEFRSLKPFKEEISDRVARLEHEQKVAAEDKAMSLHSRLDSRTDAERTRIQLERGVPVERTPASKPEPKPEPKPAAASLPNQPMPGQPMPGQPMPGQPMPGQPMMGQPMPGQPMPGQPMPGQPMPGQPMPGQPMPGQPMPGQPMMGQPMPGQPMMVPGMGYPQQMPQGYMPPGAFPPGYVQPGQMPGMMPAATPPGYPGQPVPQQSVPGTMPQQPPVPAAQPPVTPVPPQSASPPPPAQAGGVPLGTHPQTQDLPTVVPIHDARDQPELHPSQAEDDRDLPLMEELPDVM
ncbi:MAG: protein kinase [Planctomycetaceae bacterium]